MSITFNMLCLIISQGASLTFVFLLNFKFMSGNTNPEIFNTYEIADIARFLNKKSGNDFHEDAIFYEVTSAVNKDLAPIRLLGLTIALCMEGEGEVSIGDKNFKFKKNSLMLLSPNQYVHSLKITSQARYVVIGCNIDMIQSIVPKLSGLLSLMIHNPLESVTELTDEQAENIQEYMRVVGKKLEAPDTPIKRTKICSLMQVILCEIIEMHYDTSEGLPKSQTRKEEIFGKFVAEVMQNFKRERSVAFYADRLCVTPKHLSAVVKEITSHTAGELIDHYVIMEAKMMLAESTLTIQEIANNLNFANQSFFGKYFKHLTGYSPSGFRKMASI
ncbi:MAG: helix-turn-helix domain-containing protein [Lachnospiraceae bacterium]|nr:helix-turn-helix domain-containing protein [Lachnospiraceae bacterium]